MTTVTIRTRLHTGRQSRKAVPGTNQASAAYHTQDRGVFMLKVIAVFMLLACGVARAEERAVTAEKGKDRFETEFAPGGRLQLEVRSGDVRISGSDSNKILIHYEGKNGNDIGDVEVHCKKQGGNAELNISGGPRNEFLIRIEVPREADLHVRMPFGALEIKSVRGSKDVAMHAGELTMEI